MNLAVEIGGAVRTMEVRFDERRWIVRLDGIEHAVDAREVEPGWWSLLVGEQRLSVDVRVRTDRAGSWTVFLSGDAVPLVVCDPVRSTLRGASGDGTRRAASGPTRITAPMPGRVVRVLVAAGQPVVARQPVVVVEAMKMENELRAPGAGTVTQVFARVGASVETGAPLLIIE